MADRERGNAPPRVLVLSFTDHARDPRVHRQLRWLKEDYSVVAAGTADARLAGVDFVRLDARAKPRWQQAIAVLRLLARRHEDYYWRRADVAAAHAVLAERFAAAPPDLTLANDLDALPLALRLARGRPVIFDAHEYAPLEFEDRLMFRLLQAPYRRALSARFVPQSAALTSVCRTIAERLARESGVPCEVIWNAPEHQSLLPTAVGETVRLVHHGAAIRSRAIESMIELMARLPARFTLDFFLVGDAAYLAELKRRAAPVGRVRFLPPVPMPELPRVLNPYDIGLFLLPPSNYNYRFALPNKLFEFVQARLALAIGPSPEMAALVEHHGLGVVAAEFRPESLAAKLRSLDTAAIAAFKTASDRAAATLSAETGRRTLLGLAQRLLARTSVAAGGVS